MRLEAVQQRGRWQQRVSAEEIQLRGVSLPKRRKCANNSSTKPAYAFSTQRRHGIIPSRGISDEISTTDASTTVSLPPPQYKGKTAVIVGAGPAGATAAVYLARHGFSVKVFEGRSDLRMVSGLENEKSYCMKLVSSTANVLRDIGVHLPEKKGESINSVHRFDVAAFATRDGVATRGTGMPSDWFLGPRSGIVKCILDVIASQYYDSIEMYFQHKCTDVSFDPREVHFEDRSGSQFRKTYDLLLAADGANSVVRNRLAEVDRDFRVRITPNRSQYLTVNILGTPEDENKPLLQVLDVGHLIFCPLQWIDSNKKARRGEMFIFKLPDGMVQIRPSGPLEMFDNIRQHGLPWIDEIFPIDFPKHWKEEICKAVQSTSTSSLPSVVHVPRFYGPSTVLLGDAAHGMSTLTGMGCNVAIGDCSALNEALRLADGDVNLIAKTFNDLRYKEAQSFLLLEEGISRYLLQRKGRSLLWWMMTQAHINARRLAGQVFARWKSPIMSAMATEADAKKLVSIVKRDACILLCAVSVILFMAAKAIFQFFLKKHPVL